MIHILWATARPTLFMETYNIWLQKAVDSTRIKIYTAVNTDAEAEVLKEYNCMVTGDNVGVTIPATALSKKIFNMDLPDDDIVIFASDDMFPPVNWDVLLDNQFDGYNGCIVFNDGIQYNPIVTLPIMTFDTLKQLNGIIYNPAYTHSYSDNELYDNLVELGMIRDIRRSAALIVFEHRHHIVGKRKADKIDVKFLTHEGTDHAIYNRRKSMSLEDKIR